MPNYSKKGSTIFTSAKRNIDDIPWHEANDIYMASVKEANAAEQTRLDYDYAKQLEQLEEDYNDNNEAPYEGNFSDQYKRPMAALTPFQVFKFCRDRIADEFVIKYGLVNQIDWLMPQLMTLLGNMPTVKNKEGFISGMRFRNDNFTTPKLKGIYWFLMIDTRSSYLKLQYKAPHKAYCSLVPLVLYAQRLVKGTAYSDWDADEVQYVVNPELAAAMKCTYPDFTNEQLLEQRVKGLTTPKTGIMKPPHTTHTLSGDEVKNGIFKSVPKLAQVMLTQIWCAHPSNRTTYMILDPYDWDNAPKPLISTDVLASPFAAAIATETVTDVADGWGSV